MMVEVFILVFDLVEIEMNFFVLIDEFIVYCFGFILFISDWVMEMVFFSECDLCLGDCRFVKLLVLDFLSLRKL